MITNNYELDVFGYPKAWNDELDMAEYHLDAAYRAKKDFEAAGERYMRLKSRLESGRLTQYGNPLGCRVSTSMDNRFEDDLATLADLQSAHGAAASRYISACEYVRNLIRLSARSQRERVALTEYYADGSHTIENTTAKKYPDLFLSDDRVVARYLGYGVASVAGYIGLNKSKLPALPA